MDAPALTSRSNYFEDFSVGDLLRHPRGKTVEALENVLITNLVMNTAQGHFNKHYAESLPQKQRIVFGGVTAALVIGLAMQDTGEQAVEELALDRMRLRVPVLHGDTLYAFSEVVAKEDNPPDARGYKDVGIVHFRHRGVNQRGETVFESERRVLVKKRAFRPDSSIETASSAETIFRPRPRAKPRTRTGPQRSSPRSGSRGLRR